MTVQFGSSAMRVGMIMSAVWMAGCETSPPESKPSTEVAAPKEYPVGGADAKGKPGAKAPLETTSRRERQQREAAVRAKSGGTGESK